MKLVRMYSGSDGESHFEDLDVDFDPSAAIDGRFSARWPAKLVEFRTVHDDYAVDFHPAPRRQINVNLAGTCEVEVASGDRRVLGPGAILLAEDLTGRGHKSRKTNGEPVTRLFLYLA